MEFAVDAGLPIYSGGLGVLAGDHLKTAADLGIPLVGVGLTASSASERAGELHEQGEEPERALEIVRRSTIFTTHTPVPAGNEVFGDELVVRYVGDLAARAGLAKDELLALGRAEGVNGFGLTPLALRLSAAANGVSELHGEVAREMWAPLWPGEEPRIGHVTNGVHLGTWLAPELEQLLRTVGVRPEAPPEEGNWDATYALDNRALWGVHAALKDRLAGLTGFDPERLTIGFARRFATYKRA